LVCAGLPAQIRFEEIGKRAGLDFTLRNAAGGRFRQVELMTGGVAALDFDNDGCMDLFFVNGAALPSLRKTGPEFHNRLYRNNCNLTFTDVTAKAGVAGEGYSMGVAAADFDHDGLADIYVAGVNRNFLYRNRGDGTFEDVTEKARVTAVHPKLGKIWSMSPLWFDYDRDGHLDLFIANYLMWDPRTEPRCGTPEHGLYCHPDNYRGLPNQLFRNQGDGTFRDVTEASGIGAHVGKGMGAAMADFDGDGYPDIYVANDSMRAFLFRNMGKGAFEEIGIEAGVAYRDDGASIAGMGVDFRDIDNDGHPDLIVTGMLNDTYLYFRNTGHDLLFDDRGIATGLAVATRQLTGWGTGIFDFDNDGWKDLFFANAHFPQLHRYVGTDSELPNKLFRNLGGRSFEDVSAQAGPGLQAKAQFRGAAFADFDSDGRLDVVVTALNGPARLLRNVTVVENGWLGVRLRGRRSNRDGIGAVLRLSLADGRRLTNHVTTTVGYASSSEPVVRFGLGKAKPERLEIRWPSGVVQEVAAPGSNRLLDVEEP
jgi:hypothetical protein